MAPFKLDLVRISIAPLDDMARSREKGTRTVVSMEQRLSGCSEVALFTLTLAQACQPAYSAMSFTMPSFETGEDVFLSWKLFSSAASDALLS